MDFKLIKVKVEPSSKENSVEKIKDDEFLIKTKAPKKNGLANSSVIEILSKYFGLSPSSFMIVKGHTSKSKIIKIKE